MGHRKRTGTVASTKTGYVRVVTFSRRKNHAPRGKTCGVAIVRRDAVTDNVKADRLITALQDQVFRGAAVVLMAQDPQFGPVYYGRADLVRFLETLDITKISWAEYTLRTS